MRLSNSRILPTPDHLHAKRGSATARTLHVRVLELEARALKSFDIIHNAVIQVHDRGCVHVYLETVDVEYLVHHPRAVFKRHRVRETGATAAHYTYAQTGGDGVLLRHNLLNLCHGTGSQANRRSLRC